VKIVSVVGARPQFVKSALLSRAFAAHGIDECLVHTGQHYDYAMSQVFFDQLGIPQPAYNLDVGSGSHGVQTGEMLGRLDGVIAAERPDWVLVYGDTNSTLAGALAAAKLGVKVAHVEAGMRSFNRGMPEEINRVLTDHVSDALLVTGDVPRNNLEREGIVVGVEIVGDLMIDLALATARTLPDRPAVLERYGLTAGSYAVATIHRASNTADAATFACLVEGIRRAGLSTIFPLHPRTAALAAACGAGSGNDRIRLIEPLPYAQMIALLQHARVVLTDSGGVQKEAFVLGVPCVTLRDETEWLETLAGGWNVLAGTDSAAIASAALRSAPAQTGRTALPFEGVCAERIAAMLAPGFLAA
jgi:UDP-GlcNAc3NAcA epimerase